MPPPILLDTGPLVAFLNRRDRHHQWAVAQWASVKPPFVTYEAVLAESCFLFGGRWKDQTVTQLLIRGIVTVPSHLDEAMPTVAKWLFRYASGPMSLADACLVLMAERYSSGLVMMLGHDFRVYRTHGRQAISSLMFGDLWPNGQTSQNAARRCS